MPPSFALPAGPPPAEKVAMGFVHQLAQGRFALAIKSFDGLMTASLPEAKLTEVWQQLVEAHGAFKAFGTMRMEPFGPFKVYYIPATFANITVDFKVVVNTANKIGGFFVVPHGTTSSTTPTI